MQTEILWNNDTTRDFLEDLKSFAQSIDFYQIHFDLEKLDEEKHVYLKNGNYEISFEQKLDAFKCPNCEKTSFDVMEGELGDKFVLGLCCINCETYGAVFPSGM